MEPNEAEYSTLKGGNALMLVNAVMIKYSSVVLLPSLSPPAHCTLIIDSYILPGTTFESVPGLSESRGNQTGRVQMVKELSPSLNDKSFSSGIALCSTEAVDKSASSPPLLRDRFLPARLSILKKQL